MASDSNWRTAARALVEQGATEQAVELLQSVASDGCVSALVELARLHWRAGKFDDAAELIRSADRAVPDDDLEGHWDLHLAYSLGLGPDDRSERLKQSFDHLCRAARIGHRPQDLIAVALHFRDGLNEVPQDRNQAASWLELASATGDAEAARMLKALRRSMP